MELLAAGVNHTTANVTLREQLAFAADKVPSALAALRTLPEVKEAALLSTCNRMELYCLYDGELDLVKWLADWHQLQVENIRPAVYVYHHGDAVRHMMRVASGLDSLVLGEPQILGQMHSAYNMARESGAMQSRLDRVFQQVFAVAKQVRTDTAIGKNPVSVASSAVAFARHIFADLSRSRVLLIGAGDMIALVARHLRQQQVKRLTIANRTPANAAELAAEVDAKIVPLEQLTESLAEADIVISCTGSTAPIVTLPAVKTALKRRRHQPIFMVDLAVPRDVDAAVDSLQDVYLYTLDHLNQAIDSNLAERQQAADQGRQLIDVALIEWARRYHEREAADTVRAYREETENLSHTALTKAQKALERGDDASAVLERFRHDLVNKLLHHPSTMLRRLAADERMDDLTIARELLLPHENDDDNSAKGNPPA